MSKLLRLSISISFIILILLSSIDLFSFDRTFYQKEYQKLGVPEVIKIDVNELILVTDALLDYTAGQRDDLKIEAIIDGVSRQVFNDKEITHMKDVAVLYQNAMFVRNSALLVLLVSIIIAYKSKLKDFRLLLVHTYNQVSLVFTLFVGTILMIAVIDFTWFWTNFHHVFFSNDLWLLNPKTDILIMMVPEQFFFDLTFRIIIGFLGVFILSNIFAYYQYRKLLKDERS